jgi:hypothetical protein
MAVDTVDKTVMTSMVSCRLSIEDGRIGEETTIDSLFFLMKKGGGRYCYWRPPDEKDCFPRQSFYIARYPDAAARGGYESLFNQVRFILMALLAFTSLLCSCSTASAA